MYSPSFPKAYVALTPEQSKLKDKRDIFDSHINVTAGMVHILRNKGVKLTDNVYAKLQTFANDPDMVALVDTLDPQSALALGGAITGGTSGGRGKWLFETMSKAGVNANDNVQTAIKKLQTFAEINATNARKELPEGAIHDYEATLKKMKEMGGQGQPQQLSLQQINQLKQQLRPGEVLAIGPNGQRKAIGPKEVAEYGKRGFQIIR